MANEKMSPLVPLGAGIIAGMGAVVVLIELLPVVVVGGGLALIAMGLKNSKTEVKSNGTMGKQGD